MHALHYAIVTVHRPFHFLKPTQMTERVLRGLIRVYDIFGLIVCVDSVLAGGGLPMQVTKGSFRFLYTLEHVAVAEYRSHMIPRGVMTWMGALVDHQLA